MKVYHDDERVEAGTLENLSVLRAYDIPVVLVANGKEYEPGDRRNIKKLFPFRGRIDFKVEEGKLRINLQEDEKGELWEDIVILGKDEDWHFMKNSAVVETGKEREDYKIISGLKIGFLMDGGRLYISKLNTKKGIHYPEGEYRREGGKTYLYRHEVLEELFDLVIWYAENKTKEEFFDFTREEIAQEVMEKLGCKDIKVDYDYYDYAEGVIIRMEELKSLGYMEKDREKILEKLTETLERFEDEDSEFSAEVDITERGLTLILPMETILLYYDYDEEKVAEEIKELFAGWFHANWNKLRQKYSRYEDFDADDLDNLFYEREAEELIQDFWEDDEQFIADAWFTHIYPDESLKEKVQKFTEEAKRVVKEIVKGHLMSPSM